MLKPLCLNGHERTDENVDRNGRCRICERQNGAARRQRLREARGATSTPKGADTPARRAARRANLARARQVQAEKRAARKQAMAEGRRVTTLTTATTPPSAAVVVYREERARRAGPTISPELLAECRELLEAALHPVGGRPRKPRAEEAA